MISEVRVRNFKCFAELDLALAPLTLLTGVNNTGKSSVLQMLLLLRQSHLVGAIGRGSLALNGDLVRLGTADMLVREDETRLEVGLDWDDGATAAFAFELRTNSREGESRTLDSIAALEAAVLPPPSSGYESRVPFTDCRYVSADRMGPRAAFPTSGTLASTRDVGPRGEFAPQYLAEFGGELTELTPLHHEEAATWKLRDEVEAWLGIICPDVQILPDLQRALDVCGLSFTFPGTGAGRTKPQRSTHVGFGLTYVLPILVAILSAEPGDLVMIENPEAHLHPRAQREVARMLAQAAAGGVQVLVETHSDHVLNGVRVAIRNGGLKSSDALVHFFTPTGVVSPRIDDEGAIHEWPLGFFDEWDRALDELLRR